MGNLPPNLCVFRERHEPIAPTAIVRSRSGHSFRASSRVIGDGSISKVTFDQSFASMSAQYEISKHSIWGTDKLQPHAAPVWMRDAPR
jgi:hypothetical protein